ncbi:uncharacterized protein [Montipora foliosa]|uniref:uncharacterized protein n=1 Tax=Montipora foliosa TaxID=591990 RepID=UPI0035F1BC67
MAHQRRVDACIDAAVEIFCNFYKCEYPKCQTVKQGLQRLLCDRYCNDITSFTEKFVRRTETLLRKLQNENFPLCLSSGCIILHLVPPERKLNIGEFFYQVGHTTPGMLVVKFAKYQNQGKSVKELQRASVEETDYDIAFTKQYFDNVRREAEPLGDSLLRTIVVLRDQDWLVHLENAIQHLRECPENRQGSLTLNIHLPVQESEEDDSTSENLGPNTPSENYDSSSVDDMFSKVSTDKST